MIAFCQQCGSRKKRAITRCKECGHNPEASEAEMVKAVYLSSGRYEDSERIVEYESELPLIGHAIGEGEPVDYEAVELGRLRRQKHLIDATPPSAPWMAVAKLFAPGILFLAVLYGILVLIRAMKG